MLVKIYLPKIKIYKDKKKVFDKYTVCFCFKNIFLNLIFFIFLFKINIFLVFLYILMF
jgi:hypothetical protein